MASSSKSASDAGGLVGPDVVAACALNAVPGLGATALARLASAFGSLQGAMEAGAARIAGRAAELELKPEAVAFLGTKPNLEALGLTAITAARAANARVVLLGDPWYPPLLRKIANPPPILYVRGGLADVRRIALVGARDADDYGLEVAKEIAEGLALAGVQVVSGGARGIDSAAHAGALWGGGTTTAVLGCGIDIVYPPENNALFDRLADGGGAVVTELTPGAGPLKGHFPRRNRIISGLSTAVVVVRCAGRSGALTTANHAAHQGRRIFAVPGKRGEPLSEGPNALLTAGVAHAVTTAEELLAALRWDDLRKQQSARGAAKSAPPDTRAPAGTIPIAAGESPPTVSSRPGSLEAALQEATGDATMPAERLVLDDVSMRLWQALDTRTPLHLDQLAQRAKLPAAEAVRKLGELEVKGLCVQRPGKYFLRR